MKANPLFDLPGAVLLAAALPLAPAQAGGIFDAHGTGSTVTVPVSPTILHQTIDMSFTTAAGFQPDAGVLTAFIDTTKG